MTNSLTRYSVAIVAMIAFAAWMLTLALSGAAAAQAIGISAVVAAIVQVAAFAATRSMIKRNLVAAWGTGALMRIVTLLVYGVVAVKAFGLAPVPALISLVTFFFLSTALEPIFLRR